MPQKRPDILYIGNTSTPHDLIQYTRKNKVLSIAGNPEIISKGVTLGIGASKQNNLEILLNLTAALSEGLDWDPEVMSMTNMF